MNLTQKPKVSYQEDKVNLAVVTIQEEDHTLGNIIRHQLLKDRTVKFSGYKRPHPLEPQIEIKVQTNGEKNPSQAVRDACTELTNQVDLMEQAFKSAWQRHQGSNNPEALSKGGFQMMQY